jgi:hypothetical protein
VNEFWTDAELAQLVVHADVNFDGFEDLELLQNYVPHLGKVLYCVYLWDRKSERFILSPEVSDIAINLEAHAESRTLTTHEEWQGGNWRDSTYRWKGHKLELIEQNSLMGDWSLPQNADQKCGVQFTCSRVVKGKMVTTLRKLVCTPDENLPDCPGNK